MNIYNYKMQHYHTWNTNMATPRVVHELRVRAWHVQVVHGPLGLQKVDIIAKMAKPMPIAWIDVFYRKIEVLEAQKQQSEVRFGVFCKKTIHRLTSPKKLPKTAIRGPNTNSGVWNANYSSIFQFLSIKKHVLLVRPDDITLNDLLKLSIKIEK